MKFLDLAIMENVWRRPQENPSRDISSLSSWYFCLLGAQSCHLTKILGCSFHCADQTMPDYRLISFTLRSTKPDRQLR